MKVTSLVTVVAPRIGKIDENGIRVFERGENLLQNQSKHTLETLKSLSRRKTDFSKKSPVLKRV